MRLASVLLAMIGVLSVSFGAVQASCGTASCPCTTTSSEGVATAGVFTVDLSFLYVNQDRKMAGSSSTSTVLTPMVDFETGTIEPDDHEEISTASSVVQLNLQYGVTGHWSLLAQLPLWQDKNHQHYDGVGTPEEAFVPDAGTVGFGDVRLGARYAFIAKPSHVLFATLSVKLPTGSYTQRDQDGAITEPGMQPGTGSWDAIAELAWAQKSPNKLIEGFVAGLYRFNGSNSLDYTMGDETAVSGGARFTVGHGDLSIQLNVQDTGRDDYLGMGVASTGHTYVYLTPGGRIRATSDGWAFYGYVQVPVYEHVNDAQLAPRIGLIVGLSKTF